MDDDRAGVGEGPDVGADGKARDEGEQASKPIAADAINKDDPQKVEKLAKLGHDEEEAKAAESSE